MTTQHPEITVSSDSEDAIIDFLIDYCGGDTEQALDLFETAIPGHDHLISVTVDFCLRRDR